MFFFFVSSYNFPLFYFCIYFLQFNEANWRYAYFENIHIKYTRQRHYYHGNMRYMIELFDKYFIGGKNSFHLFKKEMIERHLIANATLCLL